MVREFIKQIFTTGQTDSIAEFVADEHVERGASIPAGRDGLAAWLSSDEAGQYEMMFQLIGEGDFVAVYGKRHAQGKDIAVFDIFRVSDGMIVEHWMNAEEIGPRETWNNSGKF